MNGKRSFAELLAELQGRIAQLEGQEALHAEREAFHREQRGACAAELEKLRRHAESLLGAKEAVAELESLTPLETPPPPPPPAVEVYGPGGRFYLARAVDAVIARKPPDEPFSVASMTAEVNRLYGGEIGAHVEERQISVSLRWLASQGRITRVQQGKGSRGARYTRGR